jgi:hypothetical protein
MIRFLARLHAHLLPALLAAAPAAAQEQEIQRALIQRDQQSEGFAQQLRQSQEKAQPAPGDNRHLNERQRLENLSGQQILNVEKDPPQAPRPYERQKAADERTFMLPPPEVKPRPLPKPAPLPAQPAGVVEVVPAPVPPY